MIFDVNSAELAMYGIKTEIVLGNPYMQDSILYDKDAFLRFIGEKLNRRQITD